MTQQKKKLLPIAILTILQKHTDATKHLRQAPIMRFLQDEHQLTATRKSVRKNLADLQEAGYPIKFNKGWYYDPEFTAGELDYLRACVMGSNLRADKREDLLARLATLGGPFYMPSAGTSLYLPISPEFAVVMSNIREAIDIGRKVTLTMRHEKDVKAERRRVSPYQLMQKDGTCVLICRDDETKEADEIYLKDIHSVHILKAVVTPIETVQE